MPETKNTKPRSASGAAQTSTYYCSLRLDQGPIDRLSFVVIKTTDPITDCAHFSAMGFHLREKDSAMCLARQSRNQNLGISRAKTQRPRRKRKKLSELGVLGALAGGISEIRDVAVSDNLRKLRKLSNDSSMIGVCGDGGHA